MDRWMPIRKVIAAALTALVSAPALMLMLSGDNPELAAALAAILPVIAAYLTPAAPSGPSGGYIIDPDPGEQ